MGSTPAPLGTTPDGLLLIDKPPEWTSHDVVARIRRLARTRKVGHAGTLDPLATGLLTIGIGKATKLLTFLVGADKRYEAVIRLGVGTNTDDAEGEITATPGCSLTGDSPRLAAAIAETTGEIMQVPPAVSAIKVKGVRSYTRVRQGEQVQLAARPVVVHEFSVRKIEKKLIAAPTTTGHDVEPGIAEARSNHTLPAAPLQHLPVLDIHAQITVSSGTYIRALARDLAVKLGTAGHLISLRRTQVGKFDISHAHTIADLALRSEAKQILPVTPLVAAAAQIMPAISLTAENARDLRHGKTLTLPSCPQVQQAIGIYNDEAIAILDCSRAEIRSRVVFPPGKP